MLRGERERGRGRKSKSGGRENWVVDEERASGSETEERNRTEGEGAVEESEQ